MKPVRESSLKVVISLHLNLVWADGLLLHDLFLDYDVVNSFTCNTFVEFDAKSNFLNCRRFFLRVGYGFTGAHRIIPFDVAQVT